MIGATRRFNNPRSFAERWTSLPQAVNGYESCCKSAQTANNLNRQQCQAVGIGEHRIDHVRVVAGGQIVKRGVEQSRR